MQKCEVIARYGVGVDIVDVGAASDRGILVTNVQDYCTEEVADLYRPRRVSKHCEGNCVISRQPPRL
jgi:hypothetical protein